LPARQQRQFVFHSPRNPSGSLRMEVVHEQAPSVTVHNEFNFSLNNLIVRDHDGAYWFLEHLPANERSIVRRIDNRRASKELGELYIRFRPISDSALPRDKRNRSSRVIYDVSSEIASRIGVRNAGVSGLFEDWLQLHLLSLGELPNGHFVATSSVSDDVVSVDACQLQASVRYLLGTLP
jgi:hypothetical protein